MSILANILNIQVNTHLLDNYCFYCVIYGATHFDEVSQYCKDGNTRAERVIETFKEDCCTLSEDVETDLYDNIKPGKYRSQKQSKRNSNRKTEKQQWKQIKEDNYYHVYSKQTITMSVIISTSSLNS